MSEPYQVFAANCLVCLSCGQFSYFKVVATCKHYAAYGKHVQFAIYYAADSRYANKYIQSM